MAEARKTVTVLFADVAGSTALGEAIDPEAVRRVMERFFAEARSAIERHGGTVEKFVGDAVMAVFGIPAIHEDDALRAVRAASEMRERLAVLSDELGRERGLALALRTGVNTGEVVTGDPSGGEFYATGDAVNVAARLEQSAAPGEILLGEATYRLVREAVQAEAVEPLVVKGKAEAVSAYRLGLVEEEAALPRFETPFVGRGAELARLQNAFERTVAERTPLLVTVLGPAGIGKTRLAAELTSTLDDEANVLQGRCLSYGEGITFWPLQEIVRSLPELPEGLLDPEQARSTEETFWSHRKLFERLAGECPLVLVLEDIHWAEPTLLELLEHVVEWTRDVPILLLCLARPELLDERPGWPGERLELEPLPAQEVEALLAALSGELAIGERTRISEAAEGNPLFAEQMLALALEEDGREADVPPTIQSLLAARIDRLRAEERALFECAAVVGKEFWRGVLLELSPPGTEVSPILQRLVRKRLVAPERSSFPGEEDAFRFTHVLVRDAGYAAIPKQRRADLHERFAGWLERSGSPYGELAGYHLEQAYRYRAELGPVRDAERELASRAGRTLAQAGLDARQRGDAAGAANLLSRALDLLPTDAPSRVELVFALGYSLERVDMRRAAAVFEAALAAAEAADDRGLIWEAKLARSGLELFVSPGIRSVEECLSEAEQAVTELEELGYERGLAYAWCAVAACRSWLGRFASAAEAHERAAAFAHQAGDWPLQRQCLIGLGESLVFGPTLASEGIRRCEEILAGTDDVVLHSVVRRYLSELHAMLDHAEEAQLLGELALASAEDLGLKINIANFGRSRSLAAMLGPAETEQNLRRSLAVFEELGAEGARSTVAAELARALAAEGRYEEAERYAAISESLAAPDDYQTHSIARAARAKVLAHAGDSERAESLAREAVAIVDPTDDIDSRGWIRLDLAEVLILAAKEGEARSVLAEAIRLAEQKEDVVLVERARARLADLQTSRRF